MERIWFLTEESNRCKIQRILLLVVAMCMIIFMVNIPVTADTFTDGTHTYTYHITGDKAVITDYSGPGGVIIIPDMLGDKPVTEIGERAFYEKKITGVTLPSNLEVIGNSAFSGSYSSSASFRNIIASTISIPASVSRIGYSAFSNNK